MGKGIRSGVKERDWEENKRQRLGRGREEEEEEGRVGYGGGC